MRNLSLAILASALLAGTGCSTAYDLFGGTERGPQPFGGLRTMDEMGVYEWAGFHTTGCAAMENLLAFMVMIPVDWCCSLAGDLALLPVTIPVELLRR